MRPPLLLLLLLLHGGSGREWDVQLFTSISSDFECLVRIGGPSSFDNAIAAQMRWAMELFVQWCNGERGGVLVNGTRCGIEVVFVDVALGDAGAAYNATELLVHPNSFGNELDFVIGPYSSTLTSPTSAVGYAAGKLTMATASGSPSVMRQNNLTLYAACP